MTPTLILVALAVGFSLLIAFAAFLKQRGDNPMWTCGSCGQNCRDGIRCPDCGHTPPDIPKNPDQEYGPLNPKLVCPHCQTTGQVRTKLVSLKVGVSGGKATAALLTGGLSLLAVGLSRKESHTQAHCMNCSSTWVF